MRVDARGAAVSIYGMMTILEFSDLTVSRVFRDIGSRENILSDKEGSGRNGC